MSDLIRREDVFKALGITDKSTKYGGDHSGYNTLMLYEIMDAIDSIPNAETTGALDDAIQEYIKDGYILAEPKTGKWIKNEHGLKCCSVCGKRPLQICYYDIYLDGYTGKDILSKYCPNCGAKMERSE